MFHSGQSYFFFAFLAFLAAVFFAFFAIVPPEGMVLVPYGDLDHVAPDLGPSQSQTFTSRCLSLPPSYQM
jgi:hypothetical protein